MWNLAVNMFEKMKGRFGGSRDKKGIVIRAPLAGEAIPMTEVNDPTFSEEILGKGVAVRPTGGMIVSPVNGTVIQMFDTGHAVTLLSQEGVEILIHVGLDTVSLKGKHYTIHAHDGDKVRAGDVLMGFDRKGIEDDGYDAVTPVVICNSDAFTVLEASTSGHVEEGAVILRLEKK